MGFTTGFTGGVALTLGVTYLTAVANRRNREAQSQSLRAQSYALNSLVEPVPPPAPPTRTELAAQARASFVETAKARWNQEVEGAVRWVQRTDWHEVREGLEDKAAVLWGGSLEENIEAAEAAVKSNADSVKSQANERAASVTAAAKDGFERTKIRAEETRAKAVSVAETKAAEAKTAVISATQKGIEKGKEIVGIAKAAVGATEEKLETQPALSPVEKALQQRYEKFNATSKSVADILEERYTPVDQRDNSVLRGL